MGSKCEPLHCAWRRLGPGDLDWLYRSLAASFPLVELRRREALADCLVAPNYEALVLAPEETGLWPRSPEEFQAAPALLCRWKLEDLDFWEYYCVCAELRGQGLGSQILAELLSQSTRPVLFEVEPPELSAEARRRVGFYERLGCQLHRRPRYFQPELRAGGEPLRLYLMSWGRDWTEEALLAEAQHFGRLIYGRPDFCSCP